MNKLVYVAHPIGGDIKANLQDLYRILKLLNLSRQDIAFFAPYVADIYSLDDNNPEERQRGMANNIFYFERKLMDEVWLTGFRVSTGMKEEIELAEYYNIPIFNYVNKF